MDLRRIALGDAFWEAWPELMRTARFVQRRIWRIGWAVAVIAAVGIGAWVV